MTDGSIAIYFLRFTYYLIIFIIIGFVIGFPAAKISKYNEARKKKRIIKKFREKTKIELSEKIELIFEIFKNEGSYFINWLNRILTDKEKLVKYINYFDNRNKEEYLIDDFRGHLPHPSEVYVEGVHYFNSTSNLISKLLEKKIITKNR